MDGLLFLIEEFFNAEERVFANSELLRDDFVEVDSEEDENERRDEEDN